MFGLSQPAPVSSREEHTNLTTELVISISPDAPNKSHDSKLLCDEKFIKVCKQRKNEKTTMMVHPLNTMVAKKFLEKGRKM